MTNSLTDVAKVISNKLIVLLQKCELLTYFQQKNTNVVAIFQDRNFNITLATHF